MFSKAPLGRSFAGRPLRARTAALLLLVSSSCVSASNGLSDISAGEGRVPNSFREVDGLLREAVADGDSAGLALLVVQSGNVERQA